MYAVKSRFIRAYDKFSRIFLSMVKMGFVKGWLKWTRACIFYNVMLVLVNESTTNNFKVGKWRREEDHLSFFFVMLTDAPG